MDVTPGKTDEGYRVFHLNVHFICFILSYLFPCWFAYLIRPYDAPLPYPSYFLSSIVLYIFSITILIPQISYSVFLDLLFLSYPFLSSYPISSLLFYGPVFPSPPLLWCFHAGSGSPILLVYFLFLSRRSTMRVAKRFLLLCYPLFSSVSSKDINLSILRYLFLCNPNFQAPVFVVTFIRDPEFQTYAYAFIFMSLSLFIRFFCCTSNLNPFFQAPIVLTIVLSRFIIFFGSDRFARYPEFQALLFVVLYVCGFML